jgi:hypothetical protein
METTQLQYGVSVRFVTDATMSMAPILDLVKQDLLTFPTRLSTAQKGKTAGKLFVGIDVFRDVIVDGDDAFARRRSTTWRRSGERFSRSPPRVSTSAACRRPARSRLPRQ